MVTFSWYIKGTDNAYSAAACVEHRGSAFVDGDVCNVELISELKGPVRPSKQEQVL